MYLLGLLQQDGNGFFSGSFLSPYEMMEAKITGILS